MKSVVITIILAAVMLFGSIFYTRELSNKSDELVRITSSIKVSVNNDDYEKAEEEIKKLNKSVSEFEKFFLATGDHIEIDNIKIHLAELKSFAKHKNKPDALSKVYVLEFLFEHLPENSRLKIGNIL